MTTPTVGIDISPTHGVLARVWWDKFNPVRAEYGAYYPGMALVPIDFSKATDPRPLTELGLFFSQWLVEQVSPFCPVYADYTVLGTAFMPSGRLYGSKWSFVMGAFFSNAISRGRKLESLGPGQVRKFLKLKMTAKKTEVWEAFGNKFPDLLSEETASRLPVVVRGDYWDAVILAVVGGLSWD